MKVLRVRLGERGARCAACKLSAMDPGLNDLDWFTDMKSCDKCVGTNREPIPLAEVINLRILKIGIEQ